MTPNMTARTPPIKPMTLQSASPRDAIKHLTLPRMRSEMLRRLQRQVSEANLPVRWKGATHGFRRNEASSTLAANPVRAQLNRYILSACKDAVTRALGLITLWMPQDSHHIL